MIPFKKQNDYCKVTIENGDETYSFDLDYMLAFGLFKEGHEINGGLENGERDRYLAMGIASTESKKSPEVMDDLLLRMLDVCTQAYDSFGISIMEMESRVREAWSMSAIRFIKERDNVTIEEAYRKFKKEVSF